MRPRVSRAASALSRPIPASTASRGIKNRKWRNPVKAGPCQITWQASGKMIDQREQGDLPVLLACSNRCADQQLGRDHRQRRAEQRQQRHTDHDVDRHIQPRHVRHLVDLAGEDGPDRIIELGECKQAADRIERRQRRPGPGEDHDDIGEHQRRQHPHHRFDREAQQRAAVAQPRPRQIRARSQSRCTSPAADPITRTPSAAPASRPNTAMSPARGDGRRRAMRIRNSVAPIIAAAKGISLVWLNIEPYQAPHSVRQIAAIRPARGPAINRAVAAAAPIPPIPISAHRI